MAVVPHYFHGARSEVEDIWVRLLPFLQHRSLSAMRHCLPSSLDMKRVDFSAFDHAPFCEFLRERSCMIKLLFVNEQVASSPCCLRAVGFIRTIKEIPSQKDKFSADLAVVVEQNPGS